MYFALPFAQKAKEKLDIVCSTENMSVFTTVKKSKKIDCQRTKLSSLPSLPKTVYKKHLHSCGSYFINSVFI